LFSVCTMRRLIFTFALFACFSTILSNPVPQNSEDDEILTEQEVSGAQNIGVELIKKMMGMIKGFKASRTFKHAGLEGTINLHDVNVALTGIPDVSGKLKSAASLTLEIDNLGASMNGKFDGSAGWFSVSGTVHGDMKQAKVVMNMNIVRSPKGDLSVNMDKCQTVIGNTQFTINAQGMLGTMAKNFEGPLNQEVASKLPGMMCDGLKKMVESRGSKLFNRLLKGPLDQVLKRSDKTDSSLKKLKQ